MPQQLFWMKIFFSFKTSIKIAQCYKLYQINLYQHLNFIYKLFDDFIKRRSYKHPNQFAKDNYLIKQFSLSSTKFSISLRKPKLCKEYIAKQQNKISFYSILLSKIKSKLIDTNNKIEYS